MIPSDFNPHRKLTNRAEAQSVLDETIEQAGRQLRMFDDRGEYYGFERLSFAQALTGFLKRDSQAQATILLHDTAYAERHCPRLMDILRRFSPRLRILACDPSIRDYARGLIIADHGVLMTRPHFDRQVTFIDYEERAISSAQSLFAELEALAHPGIAARVTGL